MKKLKVLAPILMVVMMLLLSVGCYMVNGQKMKNVKGTYELSYYTRTNGKTNAVTEYTETICYKAYLVLTGGSEGYYVYTSNSDAPNYRKITLSYEYDQEDSSKVSYVNYRFDGGDTQRLGVTKDNLNFSRPAVKLSETIYSDGLSMGWKRVDDALDLTYAQAQLGTLVEYSTLQENVEE